MKTIIFLFSFLFIFLKSPVLEASQLRAKPRVVALELSFVEALIELGITPIGISDDGDPSRILPPLRKKMSPYTSVGTRKQPSLELISRLSPTLILADKKRHKNAEKQLGKLAPTLLLPSLGEDYSSQLKAFEAIALNLNLESVHKNRMKEHQDKIQHLKKTLEANWKGKKILFGVSWEKGVHLHTLRGFVPSLMKHIGLDYALETGRFEKASEKVGLEQLIRLNPDVFIVARSKPKVLLDKWVKSPLWKLLKISKNKKLFFVDQNLWTRSRGVFSSELILTNMNTLLNQE